MDADPARATDVARPFLAFAAAVALFHHLPALVYPEAEQWVDLVTPFAVLGTAGWVLATLRAAARVWALFGAAAILYADGHGIHLAANVIRSAGTTGAVEDEAYFWDETWGHIEWHSGLFLVLAAICLADRPGARVPRSYAAAAVLLGFTFFTNTVEGGDWWLALLAGVGFAAWAFLARSPLRLAAAGAFALFAVLLAVWAVWHGGVPEFSELGWL